MAIGVGVARLKKIQEEKDCSIDSALCYCVEDTNPEIEHGPMYENALGVVGEAGVRRVVRRILKRRSR